MVSFALLEVIRAARLGVGSPVGWRRHPFVGGKEDRFGHCDTADYSVEPLRGPQLAAELLKAKHKLGLIAGAVGLTEHVPCPPNGKASKTSEQPKATDRVVRRLELEEERLSWLQRRKPTGAWPPEVDLGDLRSSEEELVPPMVGWSHEAAHVGGIFYGCALTGKLVTPPKLSPTSEGISAWAADRKRSHDCVISLTLHP